jgi:IS1 family transposase
MRQSFSIAALLFAICGCMWSCGGGGGDCAFAQKDTATKAELEKRLADLDAQFWSTNDLGQMKKLNAEMEIVRDQLTTMDIDALRANTVTLEKLNEEMRPQMDQARLSMEKLQTQRWLWKALSFWKWRMR